MIFEWDEENIRLISARLEPIRKVVFIMIKTITLDKNIKPTEEQIKEMEEAAH